jgi:LPS-assembly protein
MLAGLALAGSIGAASAQAPGVRTNIPPVQRDQPVFYQADSATYDRDTELVTLSGHVEFWQGGRTLLADRVTYDRNTDVAAAYGNVVLLEADGQTLFANYAELTGGMKDGVLEGMSALLAQNGRLIANGARRTDARINELSRAVYSTCNLCKQDPTRAPLWQILARSAVQDTENKMIEYRDAEGERSGIPV